MERKSAYEIRKKVAIMERGCEKDVSFREQMKSEAVRILKLNGKKSISLQGLLPKPFIPKYKVSVFNEERKKFAHLSINMHAVSLNSRGDDVILYGDSEENIVPKCEISAKFDEICKDSDNLNDLMNRLYIWERKFSRENSE